MQCSAVAAAGTDGGPVVCSGRGRRVGSVTMQSAGGTHATQHALACNRTGRDNRNAPPWDSNENKTRQKKKRETQRRVSQTQSNLEEPVRTKNASNDHQNERANAELWYLYMAPFAEQPKEMPRSWMHFRATRGCADQAHSANQQQTADASLNMAVIINRVAAASLFYSRLVVYILSHRAAIPARSRSRDDILHAHAQLACSKRVGSVVLECLGAMAPSWVSGLAAIVAVVGRLCAKLRQQPQRTQQNAWA
jgi:hypothetical protein